MSGQALPVESVLATGSGAPALPAAPADAGTARLSWRISLPIIVLTSAASWVGLWRLGRLLLSPLAIP